MSQRKQFTRAVPEAERSTERAWPPIESKQVASQKTILVALQNRVGGLLKTTRAQTPPGGSFIPTPTRYHNSNFGSLNFKNWHERAF
jgi:hypothetical protein